MAGTQRNEPAMHHKVTRSLAKKALAPIAATATAYAVKKLPQLYEQKIAPKLRERGGARAAVEGAVESVGSRVQSTKDAVGNVGSRAQSPKGAVAKKSDGVSTPSVRASSGNGGGANGEATDEEREEARQKRQQNRQARRKAST